MPRLERDPGLQSSRSRTEASLPDPVHRVPESLLPHVAAGEFDAFERLYDRYAPVLFGVIMKIVREESQAEDVLQEAMIQVWDRASDFDRTRGSEVAWLITIARSRALDSIRSAQRRTGYEERAGGDDGSPVFPSPFPRPAEALWMKERRDLVNRAMKQIPEKQRQALSLAFFSDLSHSEIASRLEEPLGTIKTRILIGMKKLRRMLKGIL